MDINPYSDIPHWAQTVTYNLDNALDVAMMLRVWLAIGEPYRIS